MCVPGNDNPAVRLMTSPSEPSHWPMSFLFWYQLCGNSHDFSFFFKKNVFTYLCICVSIEVRGRYWIGLLELEPKWLEALCKCWCWKSNLDDLKQHPVLITTKHLSSPMILRPVLSPVQKVTVLSKGKYLLSLGLSEVSASGLKV